MDFRILGPMEVLDDDGHPVEVAAGRQRALLAVLLLHANEVVSVDRLIDALWGERPPETAAKALQGQISALRKALGPERVETKEPGYLFRVGADELDVGRFEQLAATDPAAALAGWRGRGASRVHVLGFRARGDRPARGAAARLCGTAHRLRPRRRHPPRAGSGARAACHRAPAPGAFPRAAHARALPRRQAGRRTRGLPLRADGPTRRPRHRAGNGAARARTGDPQARPGARGSAGSARPLSRPPQLAPRGGRRRSRCRCGRRRTACHAGP